MLRKRPVIGFTIVELLIVIVVIGILAAITIVAFNGVSQKARVAATQSALEQASKKLAIYQVTNGSYPAQLSDAGVTDSSGTSYQYSANNDANPATYCVTATVGTTSYYINNTDHTSPTSGGCPGDGVGGVAAITNLVSDPEATTYVVSNGTFGWKNTRWSGSSPASSAYTLVTGASDGPVSGISTYVRKKWSTPPASITSSGDTGFDNGISGVSGFAVTAGDVYTISCYVRPSVPRNFEIGVYQYTSTGTALTRLRGTLTFGPAGQWTRVSYVYTVPSGTAYMNLACDSQAQTTGGAVNWASGSTLDGTGLMVTAGSTLYNYTDGNSPGWKWNGAPNASTSTGPPTQ